MNELTQINSNFTMDSMLNPTTFEQMQRAATLFSKSGLVPESFKNNAAACFVGLQLAGAIGVHPFMLFQGLYNVGGKIALETKLAVAIANRNGVFTAPITHTFKGEGKTRSCTASATLAKSGKEVSLTVDWDTVEKEGWNKRNGSKWNTMPDQMFRYRSSMWLIRTYAPEVLSGLSSVDEIQDSQIIDVTPRVKNIDEAFAEMAKPAEVITEQPSPKLQQTEKPVEAEQPKAEEPVADGVAGFIEEIKKYNLKDAVVMAYTVQVTGKRKNLDELTVDEASALLDKIVTHKGAK